MVTWKIINAQYLFTLESSEDNWNDDKLIPYVDPLSTLCSNGLAEFHDDTYSIAAEDIYKLDDIDKKILNISSTYPYSILVSADGIINRENFKFDLEFCDFAPHGTPFNVYREGNILRFKQTEQSFLLSEAQFELCERIDEYNAESRAGMDFHEMFKRVFVIRNLAHQAGAYLDKYLESENIILPDDIEIDLEYSEDILKIKPTLPGINSEIDNSFIKSYTKGLTVKNTYPIRGEQGNKARIVFSKEQVSELQRLKRDNSYIKDPKRIQKIVESPELYFDTDIIDISKFYSERVIDYGIYKPKCYPFITPYKSEWIPGVEVENRILGTTRISFESDEVLAEFEKCIVKAESNGSKQVAYKDAILDIDDAKEILKVSKKQLQNKHIPPSEDQSSGKKVLIIQENDDELGYLYDIQEKEIPKKISLLPVSNLNPHIELKEHQKEGIAWLQYLYTEGYKGGLLADDMGLGKTLQILYFINWYFTSTLANSRKPCLIVAPISLLENWAAEYEKFFDLSSNKIKIDVFSSRDISKNLNEKDIEKISSCNLVLTNYETIRSCQLNFCAVDFSIIAIDEAQKIKTPGTMVTNALKALKGNFRVALTGTPVENTFMDLWCIIDFAIPGLLGNAKEFAKKYQTPLRNKETDIVKLGNSLRDELGDYIKRRLKSGVDLNLPTKSLLKLPLEMPQVQIQRYSEEINSVVRAKEAGTLQPGAVLGSIQRLKLIADHPYLLDYNMNEFNSEELVKASAKLIQTLTILDQIKAVGEKVIIFSEFREVQRLLRRIVYDYYGFSPFVINGETPSSLINARKSVLTRQGSINKFEEVDGFNIIIMSPIAAGMGLNVVGANHVIHYSRHWNPAKEEQATDRVYRIGQTRQVKIYYPMATSDKIKTFDVLLDHLLSNKRELADATLFPSEQAEVSQAELLSGLCQEVPEVEDECISFSDIKKMGDESLSKLIHLLMLKDEYLYNEDISNSLRNCYQVYSKNSTNYLFKAYYSKLSAVDILNFSDAIRLVKEKTNLPCKIICLFKENHATDYSYDPNIIQVDLNSIASKLVRYPINKIDLYSAYL